MTILARQPVGIPLPTISVVTQAYWDGCRQGELRYQECRCCGVQPLRPVPRCPACSGEVMWRASVGHADLYSWTVVWRPAMPEFRVPYVPAIVRLEEGPYLMSSIIGCELDDLSIALPLEVQFESYGAQVLPYFRPRATPLTRVEE